MRHPSNAERNEAGECIAATDWLGNRFAVGETVLYCIGAGRGQLMAIGKVLKMWAEDKVVWDHDLRKHVPGADIKVQVLTERTSGGWDSGPRTRPAMVTPLNITAIKVVK